ncbi:hypothetical protein ZHS_48 [Edwardsiella phage vB_EpM_ZHS]|jgi:hypothetical protein|nr:hypothetical protein ZHS_48 [Edwardsiella phage vB_EpM_ZHS]
MPRKSTVKLPTIEYYWSTPTRVVGGTGEIGNPFRYAEGEPVVNVRIKAANGLVVGQITQGSKDKRDARRCVEALIEALIPARLRKWEQTFGTEHLGPIAYLVTEPAEIREKGPGPKPKPEAK